ncbi:MAG: CocE/NonD family hydrolase [Candidatus Auribacterota bacterium]|nr:CocE/NonD family hydrolase [Candidatus Auribacterota bacterium]
MFSTPRGRRTTGPCEKKFFINYENVFRRWRTCSAPFPEEGSAIVLRVPDRDGRYPVLIFRTPYDKSEGDADNEKTFAEAVRRGYALVAGDVRGRYASDGDFVAYQNEGRDGYDTIEWAAKQP